MSFRLELKGFQIALLELKAANLKDSSIHVPSHVRWSMGGFGPTAYLKKERSRREKQYQRLERYVRYLKEQHYIERVKEGERILYALTSKGQFELLRLQFMIQMREACSKPWNGKFYLVVFDIPEEKKKYRDFFRKLLKANGFRMLQLSVWMTRYNPRPPIDALLKYLKLTSYFEIMEIDYKACSVGLRRKIR